MKNIIYASLSLCFFFAMSCTSNDKPTIKNNEENKETGILPLQAAEIPPEFNLNGYRIGEKFIDKGFETSKTLSGGQDVNGGSYAENGDRAGRIEIATNAQGIIVQIRKTYPFIGYDNIDTVLSAYTSKFGFVFKTLIKNEKIYYQCNIGDVWIKITGGSQVVAEVTSKSGLEEMERVRKAKKVAQFNP